MSETVHLKIQQFGPISDIDIVFNKYTVLIGKQGAGKSTIAKLYSMFTWLEKGLARRTVSDKYITQFSRFQKNYCAYHRLDSYFKTNTIIKFYGLHYNFFYEEGKLQIEEIEHQENYNVAKVMYVPAERFFLSTVDNPMNLKNLPESLKTFLDEFEDAKIVLKAGYHLPFNNIAFEYDAQHKISWIKGEDYKIRLSDASSGYQSVIPLTLVTKFLSDLVQDNANKEELGFQERKQIEKEVNKVMNDKTLTEEVKFAMLRTISSRFKYSRFVNIVEEMEENLYPESQMSILFDLLDYTNRIELNRLVLTTHSPYIINYLTLAVKAFQLDRKVSGNDDLSSRINEIVPLQSVVNPAKLFIYELKDGKAIQLSNYDGLPSDEIFLNIQLRLTNEMFDQLLEIEEEFDNKD